MGYDPRTRRRLPYFLLVLFFVVLPVAVGAYVLLGGE